MIQYRTHGMTVLEVWFDEPTTGFKPDVIRHFQTFVPPANVTPSVFHTLVIDLTQPEAPLLEQMTKENRYEIRRATEKDRLTLWCWDRINEEDLRKFTAYYDEFAAGKGLPGLQAHKLVRYKQAGCLDFSCAKDAQGNVLVYHVYYLSGNRVRLLHSASLLQRSGESAVRSLVGRANRWLHWQDFLRFKAEKKTVYDFGGLYLGTADKSRMHINEFKKSFGGCEEQNWVAEELITFRAKIARELQRLFRIVRRKKVAQKNDELSIQQA